MLHLSVKCIDQAPIIPYADLMQIKDDLCGLECEGIELYPARSREVDLANQYHLWCVDSSAFSFPLGFPQWPISESDEGCAVPGTNQVGARPKWTPFVQCYARSGTSALTTYINSRYRVRQWRYPSQDGGPDFLHFSIASLERSSLYPYRDLMRIKDELCGSECEGIELYPARSREVDLGNECRLWIIDSPEFRFPFGFNQRLVSDICLNGAVQQPWAPDERPADCLSEHALRAILSRDPRFPAYA